MRTSRETLFVALTILLPALAQPTTTSAQEFVDETRMDIDTPGLLIEAAAGWDGLVDQSSAVPVALLITNHSGEIVRGEVVLHDPLYGNELSLGEVVIAPNTSRRVSTIQNLEDWYECLAEFRSGSDVLWRRDLPMNTGSNFATNVCFALFVNDGGRRLQLPGAIVNSAAGSMPAQPTANTGRPVQCLTASTWQIPNHHGPMIPIQAMIFREGSTDKTRNQLQWQAVGEWMCQGGTRFIHEKSEELIAVLTKAAPLKSKAVKLSDEGEFSIRPIGLGAIYEYSQPLFETEGNTTRKRISQTISQLPKHHVATMATKGFLHDPRGGRADRNRILVGGFFVIYAFLSGAVAIMLFRLTQRKIAIYTLVVVSGACVLSAGLGGMLRFSEGDLNWITVTQGGAGGAVQVAKIEVQSAGGRNSLVAINGNQPDLQFTGQAQRYYYYWNNQQIGIGPYTWQKNQATGEGSENAYQIGVPMTPFGNRRLYGAAFKPDLPRLKFQIEFQKAPPPAQPQVTEPTPVEDAGELEPMSPAEPLPPPAMAVAPGTVTVTLVNNLPVDLVDCWLVMGISPQTAAPTIAQPVPIRPGQPMPRGLQATVAVAQPAAVASDFYQMQHIVLLPTGETHKEVFGVNFQEYQNDWDLHRAWEFGQITLPRVSRYGAASAWIIGRMMKSPELSVDRKRSDFFVHDGLHLYVQEILPEDMPSVAEFFPPPPKPAPANGQPTGEENPAGETPGEPISPGETPPESNDE